MDWKKLLKDIRQQLQSYIKQNKIQSLVLGVSGGIDSALVAAIVSPICYRMQIPLIGRSLPHTSNKKDEMDEQENTSLHTMDQ